MAFLISLAIIVIFGFFVGKKGEVENVPVNSKHIIVSVAIVLLFVALMFTSQRGYLFEKSDHQQCFDLCVQKGYDVTGTSLSPRNAGNVTCGCWNDETKEYDEVGILE